MTVLKVKHCLCRQESELWSRYRHPFNYITPYCDCVTSSVHMWLHKQTQVVSSEEPCRYTSAENCFCLRPWAQSGIHFVKPRHFSTAWSLLCPSLCPAKQPEVKCSLETNHWQDLDFQFGHVMSQRSETAQVLSPDPHLPWMDPRCVKRQLKSVCQDVSMLVTGSWWHINAE